MQKLLMYAPAIIFWVAKIMTAVMPALKMAFCPQLSAARLVVVFRDASSYFFKHSSYLSASYFSLLKYWYKQKARSFEVTITYWVSQKLLLLENALCLRIRQLIFHGKNFKSQNKIKMKKEKILKEKEILWYLVHWAFLNIKLFPQLIWKYNPVEICQRQTAQSLNVFL